MAKHKNGIHIFRDILVILTTLLMISVVVFQCMEITTYGIWDHVKVTLKSIFQPAPEPAQPAQPAAPAGEAAPAAPAAPAAEQPPAN